MLRISRDGYAWAPFTSMISLDQDRTQNGRRFLKSTSGPPAPLCLTHAGVTAFSRSPIAL